MGVIRYQIEKWRSAFTSDRLVAGSTLAMAILTVLLTILAGLQWHEIHTGSVDTHELAVAAKTQAENTITLAIAAKKQADAAALQVEKLQAQIERQDKILIEAEAQARATNNLVIESKRGSDSAKEEVEIARSAQRPWMVFQLNADEPVPGSKFKVTALAQNSGKSPAYVLESRINVTYTSMPPESFDKMPPTGFKRLETEGSQTVVTPGNSYSSGPEVVNNLSPAQAELGSTGVEKWYLYAYLTYQDLGTAKIYKSRSCAFWDVYKKIWQSCHGFDSAD